MIAKCDNTDFQDQGSQQTRHLIFTILSAISSASWLRRVFRDDEPSCKSLCVFTRRNRLCVPFVPPLSLYACRQHATGTANTSEATKNVPSLLQRSWTRFRAPPGPQRYPPLHEVVDPGQMSHVFSRLELVFIMHRICVVITFALIMLPLTCIMPTRSWLPVTPILKSPASAKGTIDCKLLITRNPDAVRPELLRCFF